VEVTATAALIAQGLDALRDLRDRMGRLEEALEALVSAWYAWDGADEGLDRAAGEAEIVLGTVLRLPAAEGPER
jgi:hypothetical protein